MKSIQIPIGFEVPNGEPISIPLHHLVATGTSQLAGKTTTLEALITYVTEHEKFKGILFQTKRGEIDFEGAIEGRPYYQERADWRYVQSLIEVATESPQNFKQPWIVRACDGARSLRDVRANAARLMESSKNAMSQDMYMMLVEYLDLIIPQISKYKFASKLELKPGRVTVFDLHAMSEEMQMLVIASIIEHVHDNETDTVTVCPEAWKLLPEGKKTPVKEAAIPLVREGASPKVRNFLWVDSQDITGIEKKILKQCNVWLLGCQREMNEIKRTVSQVPQRPKPKPEDIAILRKGHFYACFDDKVKRIYVKPAWLTESQAQGVARGINITIPPAEETEPRQKRERDLPGTKIEPTEEEDMGRIQDLEVELAQRNEQLGELARELESVRKLVDQARIPETEVRPGPEPEPAPPVRMPGDGSRQYNVNVRVAVPRLTITEEIIQVQSDDKDNVGRIALLIAKGFFDTPRDHSATMKEFRARGWGAWTGGAGAMNMKNLLAKYTTMGFFRQDADIFTLVPEVKKRIVVNAVRTTA